MRIQPQFFPLVPSVITLAFLAAAARGADDLHFPMLHPANPDLIETLPAIPFEWLIRRELGGVDPNANTLQERPKPLAPIAPELFDAFRTWAATNKSLRTYAGARRQYLDLLEAKGDPSGVLPTQEEIDETTQRDWQRTFRSPPKALTMLDENTLLVDAEEQNKAGKTPNGQPATERLWAVTRDSAKPVLALGDPVKTKAGEVLYPPGGECKLQAFRFIKSAGPTDQLIAIKYSGATPERARHESYALWNPKDGVRVVLTSDEAVSGLPGPGNLESVQDVQVNGSGLMAFFVTVTWHRMSSVVLLVSPAGDVRYVARPLVLGTTKLPENIEIAGQRMYTPDNVYKLSGHWEADDALVLGADTGARLSVDRWVYAPSAGTVHNWDKMLLSVINDNILDSHHGRSSESRFAMFPMAAPDGFSDKQQLELKTRSMDKPTQPFGDSKGHVAIVAYVIGPNSIVFDAKIGKEVATTHVSNQWVLVEMNDHGGKPQLVAETVVPLPAPSSMGGHVLGSVCWVMYLPDGRLLFGGGDDLSQSLSAQPPAPPNGIASVWIWDGKQLVKLAERYSPVEAPLGSRRYMNLVSAAYDPWHNLVLLTRPPSKDGLVDCAFPVKIPLAKGDRD